MTLAKSSALLLEELGSSLGVGFSRDCKYTGFVSRLIGGKMPGGSNPSAIKSYLSKSCGSGLNMQVSFLVPLWSPYTFGI